MIALIFLILVLKVASEECESVPGPLCSADVEALGELDFNHLPVINISAFVVDGMSYEAKVNTAREIGDACREVGFFYVVGHGVDTGLQDRLQSQAKDFFALPTEEKLQIAMSKGGKAWRGYFPVAGELTSGKPDLKEGIYFGAELNENHTSVRAGIPMHGPNLFPLSPSEMRETVLEYLNQMIKLGFALMRAISLSLGKDEEYFHTTFMQDPLILFRIFNYPDFNKVSEIINGHDQKLWGVGEHTDYGILTILKQDNTGGLQVKNRANQWIEAPPVANSFVINIGDMLEKMTQGLYRSTPHRAENNSPSPRLSFPFFFDPDWAAEMHSIELSEVDQTRLLQQRQHPNERWDKIDLQTISGPYSQYVLGKVLKVFPELGKEAEIRLSAY